MSWNPLKDIKKGLKKLEDSINQDIWDDMLGVEHLSDLPENLGKYGDPTGILGSNKARADAKVKRAEVAADQAYADAKKAREAPFILANQSLAARRRKLAESSLLASGYSGKNALLSSVAAVGKKSLGA